MLSEPMMGVPGMDLPRFLSLIRARVWLIGAIVAGAVVLAFVVSLLQPDRYEATAYLLFGRTTNADAIVTGGTSDTGEVPERVVATNLALASLDTVAARVKGRLNAPETIEEIKNAVKVDITGASDVAAVTANAGTPERAADLANAFASEIAAVRREAARADIQRAANALRAAAQATPTPSPGSAALPGSEVTRATRDRIAQLEALKALETGGVRVVQTANPPERRTSPKPLRNAVIAGLVAAVLALFLVVLLARFDEHVHDEDELASLMEAPILARIPHGPHRRPLTHIQLRASDEAFLEAFEFLRLNLQLMGPEGRSPVVAVTSPTGGEGKTTVVAWLARSLAQSGAEVTAVDLDLRTPELQTYFDVPDDPGKGLLEALLQADDGNGTLADKAPFGRRVYSDDEITAGLVELARFDGNARRAARALKVGGRDIPESTLRRWKDAHASRYAEIRARGSDEFLAAGEEAYSREPAQPLLLPPTVYPRLRLLSAGEEPGLRAESIGRERLRQLFGHLRAAADYVLVDTVPISTVADASAVAAAADGVVLVADLERLRRRDVLAAKKQLENARAEVLGIVLNRAPIGSAAYPVGEPESEREREPSGM
jgi:Mrp family chromosome partitioning ATPase